MISLSVTLAFVAHRLSSDEAERAFHRTHAPSASAWAHLLGAASWTPVTRPEVLHRVVRTLPATVDGPTSAWLDTRREWLVLYLDSQAAAPLAAWCRDCDAKPQAWESLGRGWPAFDAFERLLPALRPPERKKADRPREWRDPLEIRY